MQERELRSLIAAAKAGRMSRRAVMRKLVGFGLTAPFVSAMLSQAGIAQAATEFQYKPTKAGGGGPLKLLYWQAPTLLNPHFAVGTKDQEGSRVFYEPLAGWDPDGNLVPVLAAEIPEIENGGVAPERHPLVRLLLAAGLARLTGSETVNGRRASEALLELVERASEQPTQGGAVETRPSGLILPR